MVRDVCIVGGGPAGLAAAIALRQRGLSVTVVEARQPPVDKACGEGLLPGAISALSHLGIDAFSIPGAPLRGIRFSGYGASVSGSFPGREGRGVRRTLLHAAMMQRAQDCGVDLRWNSAVHDLSVLRERWIIGADGIQSRVRSWASLTEATRDSTRFGFQRHYQLPPWSDKVEVHWSSRGQAYVTPIGPEEIGVAVLTRHRGSRLDDVLGEFPVLAARLGHASRAAERGSAISSRRLRRVSDGRIALIGDASGSVDAITGDGLALCFSQAQLLADALQAGSLEIYDRGHASIARRPFLMGDLMLAMDRFAFVQANVIRVLAAWPRIFKVLVGVHVHPGTERKTRHFSACYR